RNFAGDQTGLLARERLPAPDCDVHVEWIKFDPETRPTYRLRRDQRGPAADEGVVHGLARPAIVQHRPPHAFNRLLRAVRGLGVLRAARDGPKGRLLAIAGPVALLADPIPTGFVLPLIITPTDYQALLGPDDLGADIETLFGKAFGHRRGAQRGMPDI